MSQKRVLIVEDEAALSGIFQNMLEAFGLTGKVVDSAAAAKSEVKKADYDYLILDLTLPDQPGTELYREIVEMKPGFRGKAVFTSGFSKDEELMELIEAENLQFLPKPFSLDQFQEVIGNW